MSISQAGVYSLKLYENKDFTFLYDTSGQITLSSISNTGDVLELTSNDNFIKYANALPPADNNIVLNDHSIAIQINGLVQSNLDLIEKLQSSIYGWIPVFEFMDNQISLINAPFFPKTDKFNSQVSHTWFEELKPRIFTTHKLQGVVDDSSQGVVGLLDFDGVDDYIDFASVPDVTGNKAISFKFYVKAQEALVQPILTIQSDNSDKLYIEFTSNTGELRVTASNAGANCRAVVDLTSLSSQWLNEILTIEINKSAGVINSVTVNGENLATIDSIGASLSNGFRVGAIPGNNTFLLKNGLIWIIAIDGIFTADGQPAGNTNPAWSQSIAATVNGSPLTIDLP